MNKGLWVWPHDPRRQRRILTTITSSPHLMAAMTALGKSRDGLSNAEINEAINDTSEWTTLWVVRQLTSLGFIEYKVDFFGNPARYQLTEQGQQALSVLTGKPIPQKLPVPTVPILPAAPQQSAAKSA